MTTRFSPPEVNISLPIREVEIGEAGKNILKIGGEDCFPFVPADGLKVAKTTIAVEIHDTLPDKYPALLKQSWGEVITSPVLWAQKAKDLGANMIALRLQSSLQQNSPENIAKVAKEIIKKTHLPLSLLGINNREVDKKYLPALAVLLKGYNCLIGPVEEETYKEIIPACRDNGHCVIARTPIDINLAKQLNILITDMRFDPNKIIIDPNMGGLGYGLDYAYSVLEKIRIAAFEGDTMLNMPVIVFSGEETWRTKEAKSDVEDNIWGNPSIRSTMWESLTTSSMMMTGANIVIMRYPDSIKEIQNFLNQTTNMVKRV
jgi:acetyl-CoA decarbonylase/synthase complex subunit delta